jgi:hypothetical protein
VGSQFNIQNSKKRTMDQITEEKPSQNILSSNIQTKSSSSQLWTEKHAPKTIEELAINKKKV